MEQQHDGYVSIFRYVLPPRNLNVEYFANQNS